MTETIAAQRAKTGRSLTGAVLPWLAAIAVVVLLPFIFSDRSMITIMNQIARRDFFCALLASALAAGVKVPGVTRPVLNYASPHIGGLVGWWPLPTINLPDDEILSLFEPAHRWDIYPTPAGPSRG